MLLERDSVSASLLLHSAISASDCPHAFPKSSQTSSKLETLSHAASAKGTARRPMSPKDAQCLVKIMRARFHNHATIAKRIGRERHVAVVDSATCTLAAWQAVCRREDHVALQRIRRVAVALVQLGVAAAHGPLAGR